MKKTIIYALALFVFWISFLQNSSIAFSDDCKITRTQAVERAKKQCKEKEFLYGPILYDSVLGPYFALPHSAESKPGYMVYLAKGEMITCECWIYADKGEKNNGCFPLSKTRINDLLLDSNVVKERFESSKGFKVIFIQLVAPAKFWEPKLILYFAAVWFVIDENGDCYYITLGGAIVSFKEYAEVRKRFEEDIKTGKIRIIEDSAQQEKEK